MVIKRKDGANGRGEHDGAVAGTAAYQFELSGGRLCLDFVNTVGKRYHDPVGEHLHRYADLVLWSLQAGVLTDAEAERLDREGKHRPSEAATALEHAIALREALFRIFSAVAAGQQPESTALDVVNAAIPQAFAMLQLVPTADGFAWAWRGPADALERMLWPVAQSAAELLTSRELVIVRECAAESCGWLFLDTSRNRTRQWCDMRVCGNRAKARRHYQRKKGGG